MAFTLAYLSSPVPEIPDPVAKPGQLEKAGLAHPPRPPDSREHFGTEAAAMRRAGEMLPASDWLDLRLYGPDGRLLATQSALAARLGLDNPGPAAAFEADQTEGLT
jgi:hypothetical protein